MRVGTPTIISTPAYPQRTFTGRVAFIAPRIEAQTRTAHVRIEVTNPNEMLKLGMYEDVNFGGAASGKPAVASIPRAAVQTLGDRQVVFVETGQAGVFAQRNVQAGAEVNGFVPVYAGLNTDERVVTEGSFLLRAESFILIPALFATTSATPNCTLERSGVPARVTFVREVEATCCTEIVLADYGIKKELPLREPVVVAFTPAKAGEVSFACGINMLRGKLVVR